ILNGSNGTIKQEINLNYKPEGGVAIGDIDRDGKAEFFVSGYDSNVIEAYGLSGGNFTRLWRESATRGTASELALADFDGNGTVELYYANEIRDALTGRRLVKGTGDWGRDVSFAPVAVDILDDSECTQCAGLELVSGLTIYAVNVGNG